MRFPILLFLAVLAWWPVQPAMAQSTEANACSGTLSGDGFRRLSAIQGDGKLAAPGAGESQGAAAGTGYLPSGGIAMFSLPTLARVNDKPAPELTYRVFAMPTGDAGTTVEELNVVAVTKTSQDTQIAVRVPNRNRGAKLIERTSFLLVGCRKDEKGSGMLSADGEPEQTAVITHKITLPWSGIIWAIVTGAVITLIVGRYAYLHRTELGGIWRSLLYAFSNFRQQVSLSLVQLFIFTVAVAIMVAWHFGRTWQLTNLSKDVLYLLGISAAGATAGAWADMTKNRLKWENWHWLVQYGAFNEDKTNIPLSLGQLVTTRGEFDLYRFQALLFTLLVAPAFVFSSLYSLDTAAIPEGILSVLGLSQVTYLVGKMADTPTVTDFDNALTETIKSVKAGNRLTDEGFARLKAEFRAAMGIDWAGPDTRASAVLGDDGAINVANAALAALEAQKTAFNVAFDAATDPVKKASAVTFRDAADTSELAARKADRLRAAARLSDEAMESANTARDAARKATEELGKALTALA
jgi:hypothetical protein